MNKNRAIENLKQNNKFNPFNQSFDFEYVVREVAKMLGCNEMSEEDVLTILATPILNSYFKDYYLSFENIIKEINIDYDKYSMLIFSIINRDFLLLNKRMNDHVLEQEKVNVLDIFKLKIETPSGEKSDVVGFSEQSVEVVNLILNFSKYYQGDWPNEISKPFLAKSNNIINFIFFSSSLYEFLKSGYDTVVWENGYVCPENESKQISFRYKDKDYPIFLRIGINRFHENSSVVGLAVYEGFQNKNDISNILKRGLRQHRKHKKIANTRIENGFLKYSLKKGEDEDVYSIYTEIDAPICIFYPFISQADLPDLTNLSIQKIFVMLSEVVHLFRKAVRDFEPEGKEENFSISSWDELSERYGFRLKEKDLRKYLHSKTTFTNTQISEFISLLEHTEGRYNLEDV